VFAAYGDDRLPAQYQRSGEASFGTLAAARAVQDFDELSSDSRVALAPFLLPPDAPGSWYERKFGSGRGIFWDSVVTDNGKVRIWYSNFTPEDAAKAEDLADEVNLFIWPKLTGLMGREPLSDSSLANNGGDGLLDVYLVPLSDGGSTSPRQGCEQSPAFINLNRAVISNDRIAYLAHEFMHALQFTYSYSDGCVLPKHEWWMDATATWAIDYVYPGVNVEHGYAGSYLWHPEEPLDVNSHRYGAYVFPFFLARFGGGPLRSRTPSRTSRQ
jgi:hypothetical protein